ncbi:MAG: hypothetical protein HQ541_03110 [Mariniphaga sp.]|nr:hypothetical protein [Mariniphaga sp.]
MPYRRLPTTDQARRRAMAKAMEIGSSKMPDNLAFSQQTLEKLRAFSPEFEKALANYKSSLEYQVLKNKDYGEVVRKARIYLSHFIQVLNLAIAREEMEPTDREYYGFGKDDNNVPSLNLESEISNWGNKIIDGEQTRVNKGGNPLYSPSIALVKVHFSAFQDAYHTQKTLQANTVRTLEQIAEMRETADNLIKDLWNEIELNYQYLSPKHKRQKAKDYGLVYIYRRNELKKANPEELQTDLIFEM